MRAQAVHLVKHAVGLAIKIALNSQSRKFIGHHAQVPARCVAVRMVARTVRKDLRRRCVFMAGTKWTKRSALDHGGFTGEISGAAGTISGNNYPATSNRVFS